jgi:hypothetical protein
MKKRWSMCLAVLVLLAGVVAIPDMKGPVAQAQDSRTDPLCFDETGECIAGTIRLYWEDNGGLPVFGYPITPLRIETVDGWTGPTQWFQRDRLEDHGAQGVLAGRLGARLLELQGRPWQTAFSRISSTLVPASCLYFAETGHSLCEPFLSYWQQNGGLERFGYPITEPFSETIGDWTGSVQYFERRRMELHAELPGIPVLLGLLGTEVLNFTTSPQQPGATPGPTPGGPVPDCVRSLLDTGDSDRRRLLDAYEQVTFREHLGCPIVYLNDRPAATQAMERGLMLWVDVGDARQVPASVATRLIYVFFNPMAEYQRYYDTWRAGRDPMMPDVDPPRDTLYPPWGGFGKLWIEDANVRNRVGWAIEPRALEGEADIVVFDNVYNDPINIGMMVLFHETDTVYVFGRLDKPEEYEMVYPVADP